MKDNAPNVTPPDGKEGAEGITDATLHSEDARNLPDGEQRLGGNGRGFLAGKQPGGKK